MADYLDPGAASPGAADQPTLGRRRSKNPLRNMIQHLTVESSSGGSDGSGSRRSSLIRRLSGQKSRSPSAHSDAASGSRPNSRPASALGVNRDPALCEACARLAAEIEETLDEVDATFTRPADGGAAGDFETREHFVSRLRYLEENRWAATCPMCKLFWEVHVPSKERGEYNLLALSTRDTSYFIDSAKMHSQDHPAKGRAKGLSPAFFSVISKTKAPGGRDPDVDPEWFRESGMLLRTRPEILVDTTRGRTGAVGKKLAVPDSSASPLPSPTFCLPDDASWSQRGIWGREIGKNADMDIVREWLHFCDHHHQGRCSRRPVRAEMQGFRLIDCAQSPPQVVERSLREDYVALSYVWGDATVDGGWPRVVRDAAAVVTELGFRYLWVDRFCTDDSRPEEKMGHIHRMDEIYEGAAFTIVAAAGDDAMHGLPGVGSTSRPAQPKYKFNTSNVTLVSSLQDPRLLIERSTWYTRGWTYQEGLLARRRLVFTEQQMYWECEGMACPETLDLPLEFYHDAGEKRMCDFVRPGLFNGVSYMDGSWEQWKKLPQKLGEASTLSLFREVDQHIIKYTKRNLSRDADSLDACLGIWRELEGTLGRGKLSNLVGIPIWAPMPSEPTEENNGIPRTRHLFALSTCFWHHKVGTQAQRRSHLPSWSWAGWSGSVELFSSVTIAADPETKTKGRKILNHHYVTATQLTRNEPSSVQWTYSPEMAVLAPDGSVIYDFGGQLSVPASASGPPRFRPGGYALHVKDPLVLDRVKAKTHAEGWQFSGLSVDVRMSRGTGTETACLGGETSIGSIKEYVTRHGKGEQMSVLWFVEEAVVMLLVVERTGRGTWERVGRMRMAFPEDAKDVMRASGRLEGLVGRLPLRRLGENIVIE
ncbi:heterokaryon incompatibility [Trichoderma arundinaceum]|uniref:Heterokaryon incompatibility n=1 Tax=Trichoderma arundinaceum TaxID=490622 RepID=A0A395NVL4_TRIAR|nr:heterokaryon incompatibility [Trichoderma arundinaceum]